MFIGRKPGSTATMARSSPKPCRNWAAMRLNRLRRTSSRCFQSQFCRDRAGCHRTRFFYCSRYVDTVKSLTDAVERMMACYIVQDFMAKYGSMTMSLGSMAVFQVSKHFGLLTVIPYKLR